MKTTLRHISVLILLALCSIAMSVMDTSFVNLNENITTSSSTEKVTAALSAIIVGELPQSEVVIEVPSSISVPHLKNFVSNCGTLSRTTDVLASSTYAQYAKSSINVLIHHRKADHIFPFHYFWYFFLYCFHALVIASGKHLRHCNNCNAQYINIKK